MEREGEEEGEGRGRATDLRGSTLSLVQLTPSLLLR